MKPAVAMLVASFGFAVMGVFVKLGAAHFSTAELVFWRSALGMVATAVMLRRAGLRIRTTKLGMHVHRGVAGFVSLFMFFHALTALPLAMATTLNYTSPLFVALLFTVLAREPMRPLLVVSIVVGFAGAVLLLRPTIDATQLGPALVGLGSGAVAAVAFWNVRQLVQANEPDERVVFYFTLLSTAGALVWMLPQPWHAITLDNVGYLAGVGISGTVAQLAMTRAYGQGSAIVAAALSYSGIVFSAILAIAMFDETLSLIAWIGIALIVGAGIMAVKVRGPAGSEPPPQITND